MNPRVYSPLCAGCRAVIYTKPASLPLSFPPKVPGKSKLQTGGIPRVNPCEVEGRHLQLETTKFPLKKKKGRKHIPELGNCRVYFSLEDWLVISFREGGFLTQQMEAGQPDHRLSQLLSVSNCQSSRVALESSKQLWSAYCILLLLFPLLSSFRK